MEEKSKLKCVLQFLKQTIDHKRIMGAENLSQLCTWVDATYVLHPDMKIHFGGGMQFGYGSVHCKSRKKIE